MPDLGCTGDRCQSTAGHTAWFTNFTSVSEVTLPEDMFDHGTAESEAGLHPWNSPGAAPTYGDGCGLNGGNPDGCLGEGLELKMSDETFHYSSTDMIAGRCCGGGVHGGGCGGYVGGKSALDHYHDGLFGSPATTTWTRGQPAEVGCTVLYCIMYCTVLCIVLDTPSIPVAGNFVSF